jgi:50S ribosomal protein L16 3-hydroxylase
MVQWNSNFDREDFLQNYWQKKPLLIKNAVVDFACPLDANELAGLALEDDIESRIIEHREGQWELFHGPFDESAFVRENPWTLLVQAVDHFIPGVAQLRKLVDFIPAWRVDDVMISYAIDGGSVGPHYDNYDVFLLQGAGERVWTLGQRCDEKSPLIPHDGLRILRDFDENYQYTLSAGDILYVPPGVAHWGISRGECMTYSIGFRAPRISELLSRSVDAALENLDSGAFYKDPEMPRTARAGEISPEAIHAAREQLMASLVVQTDDSWFGELVTEPKYDIDIPEACSNALSLATWGAVTTIVLLPEAKLAWQEKNNKIIVYANGEALRHDRVVLPMLLALCENWKLEDALLKQAINTAQCTLLMEQLRERGCLELE